MAKKITPQPTISRAAQQVVKPIAEDDVLYNKVWKLNQELSGKVDVSSQKWPGMDDVPFDERVKVKPSDSTLQWPEILSSSQQAETIEKSLDDGHLLNTSFSVASSPTIAIALTGTGVSLDESDRLQNASASILPSDLDDNDISASLLPAAFSARLSVLSTHAPMEAALSGYDGVTGHHVLSVSGAGIGYDLAFSNALGHTLNGENSGLRTVQGDAVFLYSDTANNNIVIGKTSSNVLVFSAYLQEITGSTNEVDLWTVLYQPLAHPNPLLQDESVNLFDKLFVTVTSGGGDNFKDATPGQHLFIMTGTALEAFVVTGLHPANQSNGAKVNTGDTVNISHAGEVTSVGTNNQMVDPPTYAKDGKILKSAEGLTLTFVSGANANYTGANLSQTEADVESNIQFTGLIDTSYAHFVVSQLQPSKACTLKISALHTNLEVGAQFIDGLVTGDTPVNVSRVRVLDHSGNLLEDSNGSANDPQITIVFSSGSATITGVHQGDHIEYFSESGHNRAVISNVGSAVADLNASFDIGDFSIHSIQVSTVEIGSKISFEDSAPSTFENLLMQMDDDALGGGNPGGLGDLSPDSVNASGVLAHSFGADGGSLSWLPEGAPAGFAYELGEDGALLVKQGTATVLTLAMNSATGEYNVIQGAAIQHMTGSDENTQEFTLSYQVTDGDGDIADGRLLIQVNDDTPTVSSNLVVQMDDDALGGGNPGGLGDVSPDSVNAAGVLAHSFGADGGSMAWLPEGAPAGFAYELGEDGALLVKQGSATVLTLSLNGTSGEYNVIQGAAIQHMTGSDENTQEFTLSYQVTDGDGDIADGRLLIQVNDDTPTVSSNLVVQMDDDALSGGNPDGLGDVSPDSVNAAGVLEHSFGADGGSMAWLPEGAPAGFAYELGEDGALLVKQGSATVLTLSLNGTSGEYNVIQGAAIQHMMGSDENTQEFTLSYQVTDSDGDIVDGRLLIQVNDDTPTVSSNLVVQMDDDALSGGNPGGLGDVSPDSVNAAGVLEHSFGADGGSMAWLPEGAPAGFAYELGEDGALLVKQGSATVLTLSLNGTSGEYNVIQGAAIQHMMGSDENTQEFTLSYQVTDSDGDIADGRLLIQVNDDTPTVSSNLVVQMDDDALSGGNPGGLGDLSPDSVNASGVLAHSFGADGGSLSWLPEGAPAGFAYELGEDGALLVKQGTATVLTLAMNSATGEYNVIQGAAIQHMTGSDENTQEFTLSYQVTDGDGDIADGRLLIQVNDDTPTVSSNLVVQMDDDALGGGNPGGLGDVSPDSVNAAGVLAHSFGADGGSMAWLPEGAPAGFAYELGEDGALLVKQGSATVLTLSLNGTSGEYNVIQGAAIQHMTGSDENTQEFTLSYQVTDGDGDIADGRLLIQVNDDTPTVSSNLVVQMDDDALSGGNPDGLGDVSPDSVNAAGVLEHSFGADGGSMAWLPEGAPAGFAYELGEDGALLVKQGSATVLTLSLNGTSGEYNVIQGAAIQHMMGSDENTQEFTLSYQVTDSDGDIVDGRLLIQVNDDTPTVSSNLVVQMDDDALSGGNPGGLGDVSPDSVNAAGVLEHSFGADGGSMAWLPEGAPAGFAYELGEDGALLVKQGSATVLTLSLNGTSGEYNVIQGAAIQHMMGSDENTQEFTLSYQVTDSDGDIVDGRLLIQVNDDTPTVSSNLVVQMDDDALSGGNPGGLGDVSPDSVNAAGVLEHSFGADGGSMAWLPEGAPAGFAYELGEDGALLVKQGSATVLTLSLNGTSGEYNVIQGAAIHHMTGSDENTQEFTLSYQVTDGDGDIADGRLLIQVNDDTPTVSSNLVVQMDDDALGGGNPGGLGDVSPDSVNAAGVLAHSFGADGGSMAWLPEGAPAGFAYELGEDGALLVKQGTATVLTLAMNSATGEYNVIQGAAIHHMTGSDENTQEFTLSYQVTDGDGDIADGRLLIQVNDDTPTVSSNLVVQMDDDALGGGNPGGLGDVSPDSVNAAGVLAHSFGADGGSMAWLPEGAPAGFAYEFGEDGALLVKQGTATVLTLAMNSATGEYNVIQGAAIQHMTGSDENTQEFTLSYQVTDGDGDIADGRLLIQVNDDTPTVSSNLVVQMDDDALSGGNPGGLGDVSPDSVNAAGVLEHSFGADGGSMAWLPEGAPAGFAYELGEDGALLVKQGTSTVLTLAMNSATGEYNVIQGAAIHHMTGSDENTQEFTLSYQVTDGDGDIANGRLLIQVNDDTPTVSDNLVIHLDDDVLTGGLPGGVGDVAPDLQNVTGILAYTYGADGPGLVAWRLEGAPLGFSYEQSGQDLLIKQADVLVITLTLDPITGEYSTVQNAPIINTPGLNENNQDFAVGYSVSDSDGDSVNGLVNITVNDDTPHGSFNEINLLDDDALPNGNPGGVGDISPDTAFATGNLDYGYGADGGSIAWLTTGAPSGFEYEASGTSLLIKQSGTTVMTLTLDAETAAYTVVQNQAIQHMADLDENTQQFDVSYRVTDGDGDIADGEFLISVNDDTPTVDSNLIIHLDDDALTGGLEGGIGDVAPDLQNVTGTLSHSYGADGPGRVEWQTDGAPSGFSYEISGPSLLIKQADVLVITLTLNPITGEYSTVQNAPIINTPGLNENNQDFAVGYSVSDSDGDSVNGLVNITVNDDTPHGSFNEINLLDDDALPNGNPGGVGDISPDTAFATGNLDYGYGADGGSIAWLTTGAPSGFEYEASGTSLLIKQSGTTVMTLTLDAETAAYTVVQNQAIQHMADLDENTQQFDVSYRVTDGDGDIADGEFLISVNDDTPTVDSNLIIHLDDDALTGGLEGGIGDVAPDLQNVTGTLSHSYGADGPGRVEWQTDGAPSGFSYEISGPSLLIKQADVLVITLTLNPITGEYSTVQNAPIINTPGLNENNQDFALSYSVTDNDGDSVNGLVNITVNDDTPHGSFNEINLLDDDALPNGNPGGVGDISPDTAFATGNLDYGYGADGGSIAWLTTGAPSGFEYEASGTSLLIKQSGTTVMTLTLDAETAAYTVVQNQAIQHMADLDENTQQFDVSYRVTDEDGDIADGVFFISVNDDTPTVGSNLLVLLDDDEMAKGNAGGPADVSPDTQNTTGILSHSYGSDGGSISWRSTGAPTSFSYEVSGDQLLVKQGVDTVITLTLDTATGDYVVHQNASLHHTGGMLENDQSFTVTYAVTDGDGDIVQGELNLSVNDDTPFVLAAAGMTYPNAANPTPGGSGVFSYALGADQRSVYSATDSDLTMFSLSGLVGVNSITNSNIAWQSESAHALTFDFGFDYQPNQSSVLTAHASGVLGFDKDHGTYSISLNQPLEGTLISTTSQALSFTGYELNSSVVDHTQPLVSVTALSNSLYAQFTAVSESGSGTGSNNLTAIGVDENNSNYASGEIFNQTQDWVSTSNLSNGVGGDTLQKGEVLDFDLFTSNPMGYSATPPTGSATTLFLKFDGVNSEDLVVVLKLFDMASQVQTTRALVIDSSDILRIGNAVTADYQIVLDNNDGAVIIDHNDYNLSGENYLITGAQVLTSTEGITGSGLNFNSATGSAGGSTASQSFGAATTDNDVIKISDIGVVTQSKTTLDSSLDFSFAVLDSDGDASATQHLNILMTGSTSSLLETLN